MINSISKLKILLIIFPIVLISVLGFLFSFSVQEARAVFINGLQVANGNDDAYEDYDGYGASPGTMYLTSSEIRMKYYGYPEPDEEYQAGFRWVVNIPKGSTINTAYVSFYVPSTTYDDAAVRLKFQDGSGSPPSFTTTAGDISDRSVTSAYVNWADTILGTGWKDTPILVNSLQELVNDYNITALVLLAKRNTSQNYELRVRSYNGNPAEAPRLYVTYTPPATPPTVTTDTATISLTQLQNNHATLKGTITNTGGAAVDTIKFFWGTSPGSYLFNSGDIVYTGTFEYTLPVNGLIPGTTYYYKAQAHNSAGWSDLASTNERRVVIYQASGGKKPFTATTATTTLTLNKNIAAAGTVISSTGGINCGLACLTQTSTPIASGTSVVLTPTAAPGYTFSSWTGCTSVAGNDCNVTMNVNKTVTATFSLNSRPYVSSATLSGSGPAFCKVFPGVSQVGFDWVYNDNEGDSQSYYWLQIATSSTFSPLSINYTISKVVASGQPESSAILVVPDTSISRCISGGDFEDRCVPYNNTYFWRVSVKAGTGNLNWSDPKPDPPTSFDAPSHAYPWTMFAPSPSKPAANQEVKFIQDGLDFNTDRSLCYSGLEGLCQSKASVRYQWDFQSDSIVDCDSNIKPACKGNATTTYSAAGTYNVTLTITDLDVGSCSKTKTVTIGPSLPNWYEVPPF